MNKTVIKYQTNENVINHFFRGQASMSHTTSLSTDGERLYSYDLEIARTDQDGGFVVFDFTAPAGYFTSMTTSQHVGMTKRLSPSRVTTIMNPDMARIAGLIYT